MADEPEDEFDCIECEDELEEGCPSCNEDLAECESCSTIEPRGDLSDDLVCSTCIEDKDWRAELQSDYRHSVL